MIAAPAIRQSDRKFVRSLASLRERSDVWVCKPIVHRLQSRTPGVSEPCNLNRGRLASECQQTIVGHVHRQIDQDVDAIRADLIREPGVRQADYVVPDVRTATYPLRDIIRTTNAGVTV